MKAESATDLQALLAQAGWLRRFARALVGNVPEAEDLAQETLLSAWRHPTSQSGRGWLATLARNLAVDGFRSGARRERREEAVPVVDRVTSPEALIGNAEIHRHVALSVARLPEPFQQTVLLRFYEGLSSADIARRLGVPEGTIRWRVKEALERVRVDLDARHGDDRASWVAALAPLLPSAPRAAIASHPRGGAPTRAGTPVVFLTVTVATALTLAITAVTGLVARPAADPSASTALAESPASEAAPPAMGAAAGESFRHARPHPRPPPAVAEPPRPAGPGRSDAQSLAEDLLQAIQDDDYDAFVAKGSAHFRVAVATAMFEQINQQLGDRLARGHHVSPLGAVRRPHAFAWFFKLEFTDDGDDALVTLAMDGWQVAGFSVDKPIPLPSETSP